MRILITGGKGQLGTDLTDFLSAQKYTVFSFSSKDIDITDIETFLKKAKEISPHIIINCAAYTRVDDCETNVEQAYKVNSLGAKNCAIVSNLLDCTLFHISTDYIFNGNQEKPYIEYDKPSPISIYGLSKYHGELQIKEHCSKFFILRVSGVYGKYGNNFIKTIINLSKKMKTLKVVNDQITTPTFTMDICQQIAKLLPLNCYGTYHASSEGSCSWYELTKKIFEILNIDAEVIPCTTEEFPRPARRPKYSVLENFNLKLLGLNIMPHWEESLKKFLRSL